MPAVPRGSGASSEYDGQERFELTLSTRPSTVETRAPSSPFYLSHRAHRTGYTPRGFRCKQRSLLRVRSGARTQRRRIPPGYSNPPRQWGPVHGSCSAHALRFRFVSPWPRKAQRAGLFPARPRDAAVARTGRRRPFGRKRLPHVSKSHNPGHPYSYPPARASSNVRALGRVELATP